MGCVGHLLCHSFHLKASMNSNLKLIEINMSSLSIHELEQVEARSSIDPLDTYIQKIEAMAELLECNEEEAERIILKRVDVMRRKTLTLNR